MIVINIIVAVKKEKASIRFEQMSKIAFPLFMLYRPLEMIGMKEWEETNQFNLLVQKNVSSNQFTNVYMMQNSQQTWTSKFS